MTELVGSDLSRDPTDLGSARADLLIQTNQERQTRGLIAAINLFVDNLPPCLIMVLLEVGWEIRTALLKYHH